MNELKGGLIFLSGVAVGYLLAWSIHMRNKITQEAEKEDISEELFEEEPTTTLPAEEARAVAEKAIEKADIFEYTKILKDKEYSNYSKAFTKPKKKIKEIEYEYVRSEEEQFNKRPYVIPPEFFTEFEDYDVISLTYFADGVLADDDHVIVENVEEKIGKKSLETFGEYEEDCVYVRNDAMKADFEILRDLRTYTEVLETLPPR